jgi:DNA-binding beta-propeller fold protein YncE
MNFRIETAVCGLLSLLLFVAPASAQEYVQVDVIGQPGHGDGELDSPYDVVVHRQRLYVADAFNSRVQVFDLDGNYLFQWGSTGSADGQFRRNRGIGATPFTGQGEAIYVSDAKNDRVQQFTADGVHVASWGSIGDGINQFFRPRPIAVSPEGWIVVGDLDNDRVKVHLPDRSVRYILGREGGAPGEFDVPHDVGIYDGILFVVDHFTARIQKFILATGEYLGEFGESGTEPGQFMRPLGLAIDAEGNLFVSESDNPYDSFDRIQKLTPDGEVLAVFGENGTGAGQMRFVTGLDVDDDGRLYVADSRNGRVTVWARQPVPTSSSSFSSLKGRFGG